MRSVADALRRELHDQVARLSPAERIELALRLGDEDVQALAAARGITLDDARRVFARARALGRRPSPANDADR